MTDNLPGNGTYTRAIFDLLYQKAGQEVFINCKGRMGAKTMPAIALLRKNFGCDIWVTGSGTFVFAGRRVDGAYVDYVLTIPNSAL